MEHAVLILAHKNIKQVHRLASYFQHDCDVFIHFDKKQKIESSELECLNELPQVRLLANKYEVHWGGNSVLDSELYLIEEAYAHSDAKYFHLISGQDYPVRPLNHFIHFFKNNKGKEFIQFAHLPQKSWDDETFSRFQYFYPYDYIKDDACAKIEAALCVQEQKKKGLKRPIPDDFNHLYGGSQWFSVSRNAIQMLLDYTKTHPNFYLRLWMTFAPEECYVTTVLLNLMEHKRIENNNLRYIKWKYENGNRPANLSINHLCDILSNGLFFARKIELPCSETLLNIIDGYLINDSMKVAVEATGGWVYDGFLAYDHDELFCNYIYKFCKDTLDYSAVDAGCGDGWYVAKLRTHQIPFAGFDANPYTPKLSSHLLPDDDTPCEVFDLTRQIPIDSTFDLVVCKDVLPYIPKVHEKTAIRNLARMSAHSIILSWNVNKSVSGRHLEYDYIQGLFQDTGFSVEKYMTAKMRLTLMRTNCCVLIKNGTSIIR